jgi:hypothetical protein
VLLGGSTCRGNGAVDRRSSAESRLNDQVRRSQRAVPHRQPWVGQLSDQGHPTTRSRSGWSGRCGCAGPYRGVPPNTRSRPVAGVSRMTTYSRRRSAGRRNGPPVGRTTPGLPGRLPSLSWSQCRVGGRRRSVDLPWDALGRSRESARRTRATLRGMAEVITQRELRNDIGEIMRRLDQRARPSSSPATECPLAS